MSVSAAGFGDLNDVPARLWRRAPRAVPARSDAIAQGALVMAALQPLIERQGSLILHVIGAERGCGACDRTAHVRRAAARHAWCRVLLIDASRLGSASRADPAGPGLLATDAVGARPMPAGGEAGLRITETRPDDPRKSRFQIACPSWSGSAG